MTKQTILNTAVLIMAILISGGEMRAENTAAKTTDAPTVSDARRTSGIQTGRLSAKQSQIWQSIEQLILAQDDAGRPLHPKLYSLWKRLQEDDCYLNIEMQSRFKDWECVAGKVHIDSLHANGMRLTGVIRLNLALIDRAVINERNRRLEGYIPFEGLRRIERYAEILGHEMAHAVKALEDREYGVRCMEIQEVKNSFALYLREHTKDRKVNQEEWCLFTSRIKTLERITESQAEISEVEIWRELYKAQASVAAMHQ